MQLPITGDDHPQKPAQVFGDEEDNQEFGVDGMEEA